MSKKRREATERIKAMQEERARAERRRRSLIVGAVAVVVIAIVVAVGIAIQKNRNSDVATGPFTAPPGATADFGIERGQASAPVTVTVYEDFLCPYCQAFEQSVDPTLLKDVDDGKVKIEYRVVAFLDDSSTTKYSSRALATAACTLAKGGPSVFAKLHDLLYEHQPAEGSAGLSDDELADLAQQAGAPKPAVVKCQANGTYDAWVARATEQASKDGVTGTPTVLVNGQEVKFTSDDYALTLTKAIDAASN